MDKAKAILRHPDSAAAYLHIVTTSRGTIGPDQITEAVADGVPGHWLTSFDLSVDGSDPVELRLYLKSGDKTLSETWLFQYHPF